MGMCMYLEVVSPSAFKSAAEGRQSDEAPIEGGFEIDKTWWTFHQAFSEFGEPLAYAIEGEECPYGGFEESEEGVHDGFVSPDAVKRISTLLDAMPIEELLERMRKRKIIGSRKGSFDDLRSAYEVIRSAYRTAASGDNAVHLYGI